ncbi:MAG: AraC-type DNA-binding protein [Herbinix sp.]|jgi:AraC-like DNA-binding protein|nr:AraC-type DNA-binding protein [Herbinix sp.]
MENYHQGYVQIECPSRYGIKLPNKLCPDMLPDIYVGNNPIELQEFYYSSQGKGHRSSYSYRPTISIEINTSHLLSPLKNKLHKHDYFELILVASDQFEMQIESQLCEFNKGDVCILNRSTRHSEYFKPEGKVFYFALSSEYLFNWPREAGMSLQRSNLLTKFFAKGLRDTLQQNKDFIAFRYTNQEVIPPLHRIIVDIRKEFEDKQPGYQLFIRGLLYRMFCILTDSECYETEYVDLGSDGGFSLAFSAKQILDKSKRRMTTLEIAERLNYNGEHISRIFKKHYGYTISEYNRLICLRQAATMLCDTSQQIQKICKQLGFVNRTHFYSLFEQEYGCTPAEYRRKSNTRM